MWAESLQAASLTDQEVQAAREGLDVGSSVCHQFSLLAGEWLQLLHARQVADICVTQPTMIARTTRNVPLWYQRRKHSAFRRRALATYLLTLSVFFTVNLRGPALPLSLFGTHRQDGGSIAAPPGKSLRDGDRVRRRGWTCFVL